MADTYEVLKDGTTVHHVESPLTNANGDEIGVAVTSVVHNAGDEIPGDELPDYVKDAISAGDEHVCSVLAKRSAVKASFGKKPSGDE